MAKTLFKIGNILILNITTKPKYLHVRIKKATQEPVNFTRLAKNNRLISSFTVNLTPTTNLELNKIWIKCTTATRTPTQLSSTITKVGTEILLLRTSMIRVV